MNSRIATVLLCLAFTAGAAAQSFVFVSNRLAADPEIGPSGAQLSQNELFLYEDGSEIRLTFTPGQDEWDPAVSPSGRYLAYVVSDRIIDWDAPDLPASWSWQLRVMDLDSRLLLEQWQLPSGSDTTRPAGGFDIAWSADEQGLFVQGTDAQHEGLIARVTVGDDGVETVGRGVGIELNPGLGWFATTLDGYATVIDPLYGASYPLVMGEAVAWLGDRLVVGGMGPLLLIDPITAERVTLGPDGGYYAQFVTSPDGSRHAWLRYTLEDNGTVVTVTDANFRTVDSWSQDYVADVRWLDDETLLLAGMEGGRMTLSSVRLEDRMRHVLVGTLSDNMLPEVMP